MIYLKSFNLPKDTWVDYYFVPIVKRREWMRPEDLPEEIDMREPDIRTIHNSWYPWKTFYNREFTNIEFSDITILYGNNASGKTTVLNVIAEKLQLQRTSLYNKSSFFDEYCYCNGGYTLADNYKSTDAIRRGKIIVSDDVFKRIHSVREQNLNKAIEIEKAANDYLAQDDLPKSLSMSKFIKRTIDHRKRMEMSNGETGFQYFIENMPEEALVLLDEPENSLSAEWQMSLAHEIYNMATIGGCQLIIATHSPFILSLQDAKIYNLDTTPVQPAKWYELDNMRAYYNLFNMHRSSFETSK